MSEDDESGIDGGAHIGGAHECRIVRRGAEDDDDEVGEDQVGEEPEEKRRV